ncbi:MAG: HD domain-containing protein [Pseudomonadota bacterium]
MLDRARAFAIDHHADQKYGSHPYSHHLDQVAGLLAPYGALAQQIGYLHDVVEDTDVTLDEIEKEFGHVAAICIAVLTDEEGASRKERKEKTYKKMAQVNGEAELALIVKVADRIANTQSCIDDGLEGLLRVYRSEYQAFHQAAYRAGQCDDLWHRLAAISQ